MEKLCAHLHTNDSCFRYFHKPKFLLSLGLHHPHPQAQLQMLPLFEMTLV